MAQLSVIVCTYDPDHNVFSQCLESIRSASEQYRPHEIIIVDNNSPSPIQATEYVADFLAKTSGKVVAEEKQGLTHARLRGIQESTGDLLIFIDDDNFIDNNYFERASSISEQYPFIGAFSGRVSLIYNKQPEAWTRRYWGMLIHRDFNENRWSNLFFNNDTMPSGAGLCITRDVGEQYLKLFNDGKRSFILDRSKGSLMSGGDNDLAMCACDIGKGMGLFKDLHLKHYIPGKRFTLEYLSRLAYGIYYSFAVLQFMRTGKIDKNTFAQRMKHLIRITVMKKHDRVIQKSCRKGLKDALEFIESGGLY